MALEVVHIVNELGPGGTAKGAAVHALSHDRSRVVPRLVELMGTGGSRVPALRDAGLRVDTLGADGRPLEELLRGADAVHVHRGGAAEPIVPQAARAAGVRVLVETNIFGQHDPSPDELDFACHLFISQMCARRYRPLAADGDFHARHRVSYIPIDADGIVAMA